MQFSMLEICEQNSFDLLGERLAWADGLPGGKEGLAVAELGHRCGFRFSRCLTCLLVAFSRAPFSGTLTMSLMLLNRNGSAENIQTA